MDLNLKDFFSGLNLLLGGRCENLVDESYSDMRKALEEARQLSLSCQSYQAAKKLMKAASFAGEAMAATRLCDVPGGFERNTVYQALAGDVLRNMKRCMGGEAALSGLRARPRRRGGK